MAGRIETRTAVVTGAACGIGRAIAEGCDESRYATGAPFLIDGGATAI
jgi:NADP-dependent 3-hydroxy acid dehydrogenase YdfG